MKGKPKKSPREKDITARYSSGHYDEDREVRKHRFTARSANAEQNKIERTAELRAEAVAADVDALPLGHVIQVFSLFAEVQDLADPSTTYLATTRKTLNKLRDSGIVVGDRVRVRPTGKTQESGKPEATIELTLPRQTVLTRADSFKGIVQHPIVANAEQMLIVAAVAHPYVKWGLIDRMLIAAQAGGLTPVLCLNKVDLVANDPQAQREIGFADEALAHYASLGIRILRASAESGLGLDELKALLANRTTVLAGHSGVGKSSLIRSIQPSLDLRVGAISGYTGKGRHTTTSARHYPLDIGGAVIDTPGVKLFGLWNVTPENLGEYFPDVAAETAPEWRVESYGRILESLK